MTAKHTGEIPGLSKGGKYKIMETPKGYLVQATGQMITAEDLKDNFQIDKRSGNGHAGNAGRKKVYKNRVQVTFYMEGDDIEKLGATQLGEPGMSNMQKGLMIIRGKCEATAKKTIENIRSQGDKNSKTSRL